MSPIRTITASALTAALPDDERDDDMSTTTPTTGRAALTMQAIVQPEYGTADALRLDEIDRPTIADDEVLVEVHAAGLDRGTWHLMAGKPYSCASPACAPPRTSSPDSTSQAGSQPSAQT